MIIQRRLTKQKQIIQDYIINTKSHPTAEEIHTHLVAENPELSLGTVYRNVKLLADSGQIKRIPLGIHPDRYDGTTHLHHHIFCKKCLRVIDLDLKSAINPLDFISDKAGHKIEFADILYSGICADCVNASN